MRNHLKTKTLLSKNMKKYVNLMRIKDKIAGQLCNTYYSI